MIDHIYELAKRKASRMGFNLKDLAVREVRGKLYWVIQEEGSYYLIERAE